MHVHATMKFFVNCIAKNVLSGTNRLYSLLILGIAAPQFKMKGLKMKHQSVVRSGLALYLRSKRILIPILENSKTNYFWIQVESQPTSCF